MLRMLKSKRYILLMFQNITPTLLMISNGEIRERTEILATRAKSEGREAKSKGQR